VSFVSHLESPVDGARLPARTVQTVHAGRPLLVRYDLEAIRRSTSPEDVAGRPPTLWRYRELLPLEDERNLATLGEGMTPLLDCPRLAAEIGIARLLVKDESQLPTGSFKSRGMAVAVSLARELGIRRVAIPTAGNAGGALAAYAARAGIECFVFMPDDTPVVNRLETALFGARAFLVDGLIGDCGAIVREGKDRAGWFDMSTLREPYRLEGKKTMGLELAEQLHWTLPDAIFYPTGGGTGLIGMWKAFAELAELGWLRSSAMPKLFSCQSSGCAPIVRAFESGARFAEPYPDPKTIASGLRVPSAVGDFLILDALRASGGAAIAAEEQGIPGWMRKAAHLEGISLCPEAAVALGSLEKALASGLVRPEETAVLFNTGAAQKYVEALEAEIPRIRKAEPDWEAICAPGAGFGRSRGGSAG
jgi:threonine synthase